MKTVRKYCIERIFWEVDQGEGEWEPCRAAPWRWSWCGSSCLPPSFPSPWDKEWHKTQPRSSPCQVAGVGHDAVVGDVVASHHPHGGATVETHPGKRGKYIFLKGFLEPYGQLCIWSVGNLEDNGACKQNTSCYTKLLTCQVVNRHDICQNVYTSRLWTCHILPESA